MEIISNDYKVQISIHSFDGLLTMDSSLFDILQPFMLHSNAYCMYIKSKKELHEKCLKKRSSIAKKCLETNDTYFGMCYAGVEEYVVPVFHDNTLIAVIFAGVFRSNVERAERFIKKISKQHNLDLETLRKRYYSALSEDIPDIKTINSLLKIITFYIENIYAEILGNNNFNIKNEVDLSSKTNILGNILNYLNDNFQNEVGLSDISTHCHCSESYISHIFKKNIKMSISNYLNQQRVKYAKRLLLNSDEQIKNVSSLVGFSDPNYFSKVFYDICGMSPTYYRKLNSKN